MIQCMLNTAYNMSPINMLVEMNSFAGVAAACSVSFAAKLSELSCV